jgi:hypothetical protein
MNTNRHLIVVFCLSAIGGIVPATAKAQSAAAVTPSTSFRGTIASQAKTLAPGDEFNATGTIQEVVTTHTKGTPGGLHLIVAGPQGIIDASMGPYLAAEVQESLASGQSVSLTGVMGSFNGRDLLLVRQFTIGERQITVRNEKGFLMQPGVNRKQQSTKGGN